MEEIGIYFQYVLVTCENQPILTKKPPPLKHILALPILGQECLRSETELIEKINFDLGHPVCARFCLQQILTVTESVLGQFLRFRMNRRVNTYVLYFIYLFC